ncbi:uncharacterized protein LOC131687237 [Topomyia yanbarensis]|uniref:uncharacterized protein LOC131687237 n=1 Tax=Topomyia yanbarensis TaxID=2498891 RepID=UPI00273B5752|nr:uncharacterized protein LOC131687237 [Topomyia yanbarensis]
MLLQLLWTLSLDWDEDVPGEVQTRWKGFASELPDLSSYRISRYAFGEGDIQLHCFADASEAAYGTCVYARSVNALGGVKVELIASKSRVAPLKRRSIPRLELCAAQLAAHLYEKVYSALDMKFSSVWFWSDSTVVLHWLSSPPHTWKTFIANRVADIQETTRGGKWCHVPGATNPADLVSRGMTVEQLVNSSVWRHGPHWMQGELDDWPKQNWITSTTHSDEELERKHSVLTIQTPTPPNPLVARFSSYLRMVRTTAYCLRFFHNARGGKRSTSTVLLVHELERAKTVLVKIVQRECFDQELKQLKQGKNVTKRSSLKLLNPFVDSSGLIRVGGRLRLSDEIYSTRHPILLPGFHHFTRLLLMSYHLQLLHGGIALTLAVVRNEYWPINGKRAVRSTIRRCYSCVRANPQPIKQPMGQLPHARVTPSRPFSRTGIDYCGPVYIKSTNRKTAPAKAYIALFVCFSTKAVHIELVGDLSTSAFMSALRRFVARRGRPEHLFSDNATNFIGAKNELHALYKMLTNHTEIDRIATSLATEGITWHMIPPRAPNFGGLWEAAVKVAKRHLVRQLGNTVLFYEDLLTILAQIESCMNSRPLVSLSEDPNDLHALTPGHFLIGASLQAIPDPDWREVPINRLNRFQFVQQKVQHFWYRWRNEYLKELQRQATVNPEKVNLKVGQVVILQDELLPPMRWSLARVEEIFPGKDDVSRVVVLRTPSGTFKRPASKVCPLPDTFDEDEEVSATLNQADDIICSSN